jgi:hypothetical protein
MDWAGDCKVLAVRFLFQQILAIVECDCISIEYRHLATNRKNTTIVAVSQCLLSPCPACDKALREIEELPAPIKSLIVGFSGSNSCKMQLFDYITTA